MGSNKMRFAIGITVVIAALVYFAASGFQEGKAYYKTLEELNRMGDSAYGKRLKVAGTVADGSIKRLGREVTFQLVQNELMLPVRYTGSSPVPDTFKDGTEAVIEGQYYPDGTFEAIKIQAKCASKYKAIYKTTNEESI